MFGLLPDALVESGFFELLVTAGLVFYIAARLSQQRWATPESNAIRVATSWAFWSFACILLVITLFKVPGCERSRYQPQAQEKPVPQTETVAGNKNQVPDSSEKISALKSMCFS